MAKGRGVRGGKETKVVGQYDSTIVGERTPAKRLQSTLHITLLAGVGALLVHLQFAASSIGPPRRIVDYANNNPHPPWRWCGDARRTRGTGDEIVLWPEKRPGPTSKSE